MPGTAAWPCAHAARISAQTAASKHTACQWWPKHRFMNGLIDGPFIWWRLFSRIRKPLPRKRMEMEPVVGIELCFQFSYGESIGFPS